MDQKIRRVESLLGVSSHVLNNPGFPAFNMGDAVFVVFGTGVNAHCLVDGSGQVSLCCLARKIRPRNFDLQTGLVRSGSDDVKILCVHLMVTTSRSQTHCAGSSYNYNFGGVTANIGRVLKTNSLCNTRY